MDLMCTPEEEQIVTVASDFFSATFPLQRLRAGKVSEDRRKSDAWRQSLEMGLFSGGIPAWAGGAGLTLAQLALIFRVCGRHLVDPAALAIVLATHVAVESGEADLARRIGEGSVTVGLTNMIDPNGSPQGPAKFHLIDANGVELLLVWNEAGGALYPATDFDDVDEVLGLDGAVPLARATLSATAKPCCEVMGPGVATRARILIASMLVGIAEATRDMAVGYALIREQFGKPIGSFQAIKHFCADMATRAEAAYSQLVFAALSDENADYVFQSHSLLIVAIQAAEQNALKNIQIHGGMGFTAECDAHLFLKRTHLLMRLQGGLSRSRQLLIDEQPPMAA